VLEAYEVRSGEIDVQTAMRVIIGSALDTRTPLFDGQLRFIEFSPYWNVPLSIARSEVVPKILRDPGYFTRQGSSSSPPTGGSSPRCPWNIWRLVRQGRMRIRQRPGPNNALGDIKFIFPNKDSIFLHHTPSTSLFDKERRDLSHGCIRVEDPVGLAKFVLQYDPVWGEERIRQAMSSGVSSTLRLREPVQVVLAYNTVQVKDGRVHFFADIYGQDKLLDQALRGLSAPAHDKLMKQSRRHFLCSMANLAAAGIVLCHAPAALAALPNRPGRAAWPSSIRTPARSCASSTPWGTSTFPRP
jgi:L,D-transpeptidase YcbB